MASRGETGLGFVCLIGVEHFHLTDLHATGCVDNN